MMESIKNKQYFDHKELSLLLPWYVNKTLHSEELKKVENHLSVCLVCKREVKELQKLAQIVQQSGSLDSSEQIAFTRLKNRLHLNSKLFIEPVSGAVLSFDSKTSDTKSIRKKWLITNMARTVLATAAVLLLSVTLFNPRYLTDSTPFENTFRTLSDGQLHTVQPNEIRIVFASDVKHQQLASILKQINGELLSKTPTEQGVYTVRLASNAGGLSVHETVNSLRKDQRILFVEPAYALLSSEHSGQ